MQPPVKPDDSDCCHSGCTPCIFEIYERQLQQYEKYLKNGDSSQLQNYKNCLSQTSYSYFKLRDRKEITNKLLSLVFQYFSTENVNKLFYEPGQHFLLKSERFNDAEEKHSEKFTRAYTPIPFSDDDEFNSNTSFKILIKIYENGKMSKFIQNLKIDDLTLWRGPYGNYKIKYDFKHILCISQGTGIAPIYSVTHKLLENEDCYTKINLFSCYKNFEEYLLRDQIHNMKSFWNFNATIFLPYEIESAVSGKLKYNEHIEYRKILENDIDIFLQTTTNDIKGTQVLLCGNKNFIETMSGFLQKYQQLELFVF